MKPVQHPAPEGQPLVTQDAQEFSGGDVKLDEELSPDAGVEARPDADEKPGGELSLDADVEARPDADEKPDGELSPDADVEARPDADEKPDKKLSPDADVEVRPDADEKPRHCSEEDGVTVERQDNSDLAAEQGGLCRVRQSGVRVAIDDSSDNGTPLDNDVNGCCCLRYSVVALLNDCSGHELENGKPGVVFSPSLSTCPSLAAGHERDETVERNPIAKWKIRDVVPCGWTGHAAAGEGVNRPPKPRPTMMTCTPRHGNSRCPKAAPRLR